MGGTGVWDGVRRRNPGSFGVDRHERGIRLKPIIELLVAMPIALVWAMVSGRAIPRSLKHLLGAAAAISASVLLAVRLQLTESPRFLLAQAALLITGLALALRVVRPEVPRVRSLAVAAGLCGLLLVLVEWAAAGTARAHRDTLYVLVVLAFGAAVVVMLADRADLVYRTLASIGHWPWPQALLVTVVVLTAWAASHRHADAYWLGGFCGAVTGFLLSARHPGARAGLTCLAGVCGTVAGGVAATAHWFAAPVAGVAAGGLAPLLVRGGRRFRAPLLPVLMVPGAVAAGTILEQFSGLGAGSALPGPPTMEASLMAAAAGSLVGWLLREALCARRTATIACALGAAPIPHAAAAPQYAVPGGRETKLSVESGETELEDDGFPVPLVRVGPQGRVCSANAAAAAFFGMPAAAMEGQALQDWLGDALALDQAMEHVPTTVECRVMRPRGGSVRCLMTIGARDSRPSAVTFPVVFQDVQRLFETKERYRDEREALQVTLEAIGDAVVVIDREGSVSALNVKSEKLLGWQREDARGVALSRIVPAVEDRAGRTIADFAQYLRLRTAEGPCNETVVLFNRFGEEYHMQCRATPVLDTARGGLVLVMHDVTQDREMADLLTFQATHDALTGLLNRTVFENRVKAVLESETDAGVGHVVCVGDIDQFKAINDACGHLAGDELLRQLSSLLRDHLREADLLARIGGDQFGVLFDNCSVEQATTLAQGIVDAVADYRFVWRGNVFAVGISFGLVKLPGAQADINVVMEQADAACVSAKNAGRGRVETYREHDQEHQVRQSQTAWVASIHQALDQSRFHLFVQKIAPLRSGEPIHYEVLLRMQNEGGQLVPPGAFIPAAERYGMIQRIDRWVVGRALERVGAGLNQSGEEVRVSINLSGASIGDESFWEYIEEQLQVHGVPPSSICFEITETVAISNLSRAVEFLSRLRRLGCHFALDDFGSGVASFAYLKRLPLDYVKIDGHFIRGMYEDALHRTIVESIVRIAAQAGLKTIAEFVEDSVLLDQLKAMGVDFAQGRAVGLPVPIDTLFEAAPEPAS